MQNGEIKIEDGIPVPAGTRKRKPKYPWGDMDVGQSIFLVGAKTTSAAGAAKKATGNAFTARHVEGGVRVWRTA